MKRWLIFALTLLAALLPAALGAPQLSAQQEARVQTIGGHLRCPVCRGLSITESPNDISAQMLRDVREQVAAGRSDEQIYEAFAARFGQTVLLDPPKQGLNLALWGLPALAGLLGGWLLARYLRGASHAAPELPDAAVLARVQRDLEAGP